MLSKGSQYGLLLCFPPPALSPAPLNMRAPFLPHTVKIYSIYRQATPTQASESEDSIEFRKIKNINLLELLDTDPHLHLLKKLIPDFILVRGLLPYKKIQQFHLPNCNQVAHAPQNQ